MTANVLQSLSRARQATPHSHGRLVLLSGWLGDTRCLLTQAERPLTTLKCSREFSPQEVSDFMALTGDVNPLHTAPQAAQQAGFSGPILPGMLSASLFPALISRSFPGAVYLSQTLKFKAPALIGDVLTATVTVDKVRGSRVSFNTICSVKASDNSSDGGGDCDPRVVVEGKALAFIPQAALNLVENNNNTTNPVS